MRLGLIESHNVFGVDRIDQGAAFTVTKRNELIAVEPTGYIVSP